MRLKFLPVFYLCLLLASPTSGAQETNAAAVFVMNAVAIQQVAATGASEVSASATFESSPENLWREVIRFDQFGGNGPFLRVKKVTARGDQTTDINFELRLPWPLSKISCVLTFEQHQTEKKVSFRRKSGCMSDLAGTLGVLPEADGRARLTYAMAVESGPMMPRWLLEWGMERALPLEFHRLANASRVVETASLGP